jgi:hypothetical protein
MSQPYTRKLILAYPITIASGLLNELTISTLPAKQVRAISKEHDLDNDPDGYNALDREFDIAVAMTGQPGDVIAQLAKPDYNSLTIQIARLINFSTPDLLEDDYQASIDSGEKLPKPVFSDDAPVLLVPVNDAISGLITEYRITPPTVGLTRQIRKEKDQDKRGMMVSATCTGLHPDVIDQMHMPDFNHLMERVRDFLTQPADFFQTETSTD